MNFKINIFQGCKFRMHVPNVVRSCDIRVKEIMLKHPKLTTIEPPQLNYEKKIMKLVDSDPGINNIVIVDNINIRNLPGYQC